MAEKLKISRWIKIPFKVIFTTAYNEFAVRFREYGQTEKAWAFLHANLGIISSIRSQAGRSVSLSELGALYEEFEFRLTDEEKAILKGMVRKAEIY